MVSSRQGLHPPVPGTIEWLRFKPRLKKLWVQLALKRRQHSEVRRRGVYRVLLSSSDDTRFSARIPMDSTGEAVPVRWGFADKPGWRP